MYDLGTGIESVVCDNPADQWNPAIDGNRVVWQDRRNGNWDIYLYDIGSGVETRITDDSGYQMYPAISGDRVVWEEYRNGNADIYMADLSPEIVPSRATVYLKAQVIGYNLPMNIEAGFTDKLDIAIAALAAGNEKMAVNNLNAVIKLARAQKGKSLSPGRAGELIAEAQMIIQNILL